MSQSEKEARFIEQILKKGLKLITLYGLKHFTVEYLAKNLGMSKKTIYKYFPSKNILVEEMFDYFNEIIINKLKQILMSSMSPIEKYIVVIDFISGQIDQMSIYKFIDIQQYTAIIEGKFKIFRQNITFYISSLFYELQDRDFIRKDLNNNVIASIYMDQIIFSFYPKCFFDNASKPAITLKIFSSLIAEGIFTKKGNQILKEY